MWRCAHNSKEFLVPVILKFGFVGKELLPTCTGLSDTGVWLRILKPLIKCVLVVSTLVLGASVNHSHNSDTTAKALPAFHPHQDCQISYIATLCDAAFYFIHPDGENVSMLEMLTMDLCFMNFVNMEVLENELFQKL